MSLLALSSFLLSSAIAGAAVAMTLGLLWGFKRKRSSTPALPSIPNEPTFSERPIADIERMFETLLARGRIIGTRAAAEDRARARLPAHAGPVFRKLAGTYQSLRLVDADVTINLHAGSIMEDALGGWRLDAIPDEIDIRLAPQGAEVSNASGDVVFDAMRGTRSTREIVLHSTLLHCIVRAVVGDGDGG